MNNIVELNKNEIAIISGGNFNSTVNVTSAFNDGLTDGQRAIVGTIVVISMIVAGSLMLGGVLLIANKLVVTQKADVYPSDWNFLDIACHEALKDQQRSV